MREYTSGQTCKGECAAQWSNRRSKARMWTQVKPSLGLTHRVSGASTALQSFPIDARGPAFCTSYQSVVGCGLTLWGLEVSLPETREIDLWREKHSTGCFMTPSSILQLFQAETRLSTKRGWIESSLAAWVFFKMGKERCWKESSFSSKTSAPTLRIL